MVRKLIGMFLLTILVGVMCGVAYANPIPVQVTLGASTAGWVIANNNGVAFSGLSGWAYQGATSGSFSLSNANISGSGGTLGPNSETLTVWIGPDTVIGTLSLNTVTTVAPLAFVTGTYTVTSATGGFVASGYPVGYAAPADFSVFGGNVSSGQIVPDPVPEPGTIALVGSGLLAMAGVLRRRL